MRSKKALYNAISSFVLQIIVIIYGFIIPKIIISKFGSNVNGLISSITQFLGYISLLESGFGPVVLSLLYKPIAEKDNNKIANILYRSEHFFRKIALIFIAYIIILCFVYPLFVNNDFDFIFTLSLILIISMSTFAEYFFGMTYKLFIQADQKSYVISFIQIITYILNLIIIFVLVKLNCGIHIIKLCSGVLFVIRPLLQNYYVKKKYNINFENVDKKFEIENKWDGLAQHIASVIHNKTDVTVLTIFSELSNVSIYSVYKMIITSIKKIVNIITNSVSSGFGDMIAKKEKENLNKKFSMFEVGYNTVVTIIFSCSIILITPFISIYTKSFDINYCNYAFGYLFTISEYVYMIRIPYIDITYSAGHFKETKKGAWVECIVNLSLSLVLIIKYGLVGVSVGTLIAMIIRTIEFVYHSNKYILDRNIFISFKKIILVIVETLLIIFISSYLPMISNITYLNWIVNGFMVFGVACIITLSLNYIFYKNEIISFMKQLKRLVTKK